MDHEQHEPYESLTDRELEILRLIAAGLTNQQIADQLFVTLDTVKWHNKHSFQKLHVSNRTQAVARARELGLLEILAESKVSPRGAHNLPTQTTTFIGREEDLNEIKRLLLDEPACRLLTLVGPGGIGKSRLALAAAAQMVNAFPDGVFFVPLAAVDDANYIVPAIAEVLHFTFYGKADPAEQLLNYLQHKALLLVVDNFEHLLDGAHLLGEMMKHAPGVKLLATSRERLRLREEWNFEVLGLTYPAINQVEIQSVPESEFETFQAVQLFIQRASQADASFTPTTEEMADIAQICQLVEGMPLGLELAAPWIRSLSCHEIALEIERNLDFLTTTLRNLPDRHRSLRVVIEQTWQRLSPAEQSVLKQLSVFRGGCTRQTVENVTNATLADLSSLIDKVLLRRTDTGRFELHELIRQFGEEQLEAEPDALEQTQQRHKAYFITFLEQRTAGVKGLNQMRTMAEIKADLDNVRLAWRRSVTDQDADAIERAAECLFVYYLYGNGYDEGYSEFGRAANALIGPTNLFTDADWEQTMIVPDEQEVLVSYLLAAHGYFLAHRRDLPAGQVVLEEAVRLLRRNQSSADTARLHSEAFALGWLGWVLYFQGRLLEGKRYARESLTLVTETADRWVQGWVLCLLGGCERYNQPEEAAQAYRSGLAVCQESGDQSVLSYNSYNLGSTLTILGLYEQAKPYFDDGVRIAEQMQNILGLGYGLFYRGQLEIFLGDYQQAIQTLEQCITHFNEVGTIHACRARTQLGLAFLMQGDYSLAAQSFARSLEGFKLAESRLGLGDCLNGLGALSREQGNFHKAAAHHREALTLWQDMEMDAEIATSRHYLGRVLVMSGEPHHAEARQHLQEALELAAKLKLAPLALAMFVDFALLLFHSNQRELATKLAALAEQHDASTFETRLRARQTLAQVGFDSTSRQGQPADLWAIIQELLSDSK